jgi:hypothetical protein
VIIGDLAAKWYVGDVDLVELYDEPILDDRSSDFAEDASDSVCARRSDFEGMTNSFQAH